MVSESYLNLKLNKKRMLVALVGGGRWPGLLSSSTLPSWKLNPGLPASSTPCLPARCPSLQALTVCLSYISSPQCYPGWTGEQEQTIWTAIEGERGCPEKGSEATRREARRLQALGPLVPRGGTSYNHAPSVQASLCAGEGLEQPGHPTQGPACFPGHGAAGGAPQQHPIPRNAVPTQLLKSFKSLSEHIHSEAPFLLGQKQRQRRAQQTPAVTSQWATLHNGAGHPGCLWVDPPGQTLGLPGALSLEKVRPTRSHGCKSHEEVSLSQAPHPSPPRAQPGLGQQPPHLGERLLPGPELGIQLVLPAISLKGHRRSSSARPHPVLFLQCPVTDRKSVV